MFHLLGANEVKDPALLRGVALGNPFIAQHMKAELRTTSLGIRGNVFCLGFIFFFP